MKSKYSLTYSSQQKQSVSVVVGLNELNPVCVVMQGEQTGVEASLE